MKKWWQHVRGDVMGGATAAIVALPLGLAFGIASGAGAVAGLYGSVFGGLIAAIFGGCGVQITGPTGAMTVVLVRIIGQYGIGGMLLTGALAGLMQVVLGLLRLGGFVKYLPQPVIAGFTNGISILFFMTAIGDAFETLPITIITIAAILLAMAMRWNKKIPESLFGLTAGLVINELFIHSPHVVGDLSFHLPRLAISSMPFNEVGHLLMPAFTICLLGSISALLSAKVTDGMTGINHDSNRELIGQGLGNLVSSMIGGLPVSGAVARSGINVLNGGRTRLSSILHAVFLLLMVLVLGPVVRRIPLASLAAILMVASVRTADWKSLKLMPRARWSYGAIMMITAVLTVVKDLAIAVIVGVLLAGIAVLVEMAFSPRGRIFSHKSIAAPVIFLHPDLEVIALHGPLFFVGVENTRHMVMTLSEKAVLVLDLSDVFTIDETGALALRDLVMQIHREGKSVYIGGLNRQPARMLIRMGVVGNLGRFRVCRKLEIAMRRAYEKVSQGDMEECVPGSVGIA
ncbi:MAG TPA: SulP family inorganic anion transporter [Firmicutes bacterium]|nr:SulP family inorganic anion transporter [Bacillota bacterium]